MFNMMQGELIWKLSNRMPCLSAIKYIIRGTKCIQSDMPTKLQILHSYKDVSKYNIIQEQKNERYSFLVPCGKNKYLFSSERKNSTFGITSLVVCNPRSRPVGQLLELFSCYSSAMMFQVFKDAGIIKSMMPFPSMQQMCMHLSICKINSGQPNGELKMYDSIFGISDKLGEKRSICTTEATDKKIEFCPPKKSKGEENKDSCDSEEATAKTGEKGDSKKECLTPKGQNHTFCAKGEDKHDLGSKGHLKASAPSQESYCGQDDSKKECLMPKTQATQTFCANVENKNDLLSTTKTQMKAPAHSSHSVKCEGKNESSTTKGQCKSGAQPSYCTKSDSKKESKPKTSATQVHCTKSEPKSEPSASPKPQMKAASCSAPGANGPDKKPPKKEESKKEGCGSKSQAKSQEAKGSDKKLAQKEEAKKDPGGHKPPLSCEHKEPEKKECSPPKEEKKRVGCEPEPKKCASGATPDKKLKGNVPYPCPRMKETKKKDKGGIPVWQCALVSGLILLIAIIIIWSITHKKEPEPELDAKGRPIKK